LIIIYIKECIETIYPKAIVEGEPIPGKTGCFEIYLGSSEDKKNLIFSKLNGDGKFNE
jgi:hypothetical protein